MSREPNLERVQSAALQRIEQHERTTRAIVAGAAAFEALFLLAYVLLADFSNRLHLLLLIATVGSYTVIVLSLFVLGTHVSRNAQRVLRALELLDGAGRRSSTGHE